MKTDLQDAKRELRGYLKAYRICRDQAEEIARQIERGEVPDAVKEMLLQAKRKFETHCRNVNLILGYLSQGSTMYRVVSLRYLQGMNMKDVAGKLGYSVGHCDNVESMAIDYLVSRSQVMELIGKKDRHEKK